MHTFQLRTIALVLPDHMIMTVTNRLASFVSESNFEALPANAIEAAKRGLLDTIGVAIAGVREPASTAMVRVLETLGGTATASVIGKQTRTNAPQAAFANGVMAHALDFDDDIGAGYGHPSAVLVPTVLALGESLGASGRDVIEAYVLGVEAWYRIARAMPRLHPLGWHPTGIFGAIGAAAAAARLMKLGTARTAAALGLAASQSAGLIQNLGTMTKPFHAGNAARSGIMAALLAVEGWTASTEVLEGPLGFSFALGRGASCDVGSILDGLGASWAIVNPGLNVKRYPCYYSAHKCIDAMLSLARERDIDPSLVESVHCRVPARVKTILFHVDPKTGLEAKFSMHFFMAAALVDRALGLAQFVDTKPSEPAIRTLMARVHMSVHPTGDGVDPPHDYPDTVEVQFRDGTCLTESVTLAKGNAENPLTWHELNAKFRACATLNLAPDKVQAIEVAVTELERADSVEVLGRLLRNVAGR